MSATDTALTADWLGACRRASAELARVLASTPSPEARAVETGTRGEGGDRTLVIDRSAEDAVLEQLAALHAEGHAFTAVSEERGEVSFGGGPVRVVIDPIDGSLNAKRGAGHYALSVAVAGGTTMADVSFGYVHDLGAGEEWWAMRGHGAFLRTARDGDGDGDGDGERLDPERPERRDRDGRLELLGIESADPRWVRDSADGLVAVAHRLRALGTIAVSLCQVAAGRWDGMLTLRRSRGVDAAAGQLIVREAGGLVAFPECPEPLAAPLDATPSSRVVAARSAASLEALCGVSLG